MEDQAIEIADSTILCSFCILLANSSLLDNEDIKTIFGSFGALSSAHSEELVYATLSHVSAALLFHSSPLLLTITDIVFLIESLYESTLTDNNANSLQQESNDIQDFAQYITSKIPNTTIDNVISIDMAKDLLEDIREKSKKFGFSLDNLNKKDQTLQLIQKRLLLNSIYIDNIDLNKDVVAAMGDYEPFVSWYNGPYSAFKYYWDNFASITSSLVLKYHDFCKESSVSDLFEHLISPLNLNSYSAKVEPTKWMHKVILPVLTWKGSDLHPLHSWMFNNEKLDEKFYSQKQKLWLSIINALVNSEVPFENFKSIIESFISVCYYVFCSSFKLSSLEMLQCFDLIKETCSMIIPILPTGLSPQIEPEFSAENEYNSLDDFIQQSNLKPLLQPTKYCAIQLSEMIDTCTQLYPINQLTVPKYLTLKYSTSNVEDSKREVSKIINGLKTSSSSQLLNSLELFKSTFVKNDDSMKSIDYLVVDRFLFNNLFEIVNKLYDQNKFGISSDQLYQLLLKKFWGVS